MFLEKKRGKIMESEKIGNRIEEILKIKNIEYDWFSSEIGISKRKLIKKLKGKLCFTLGEATKIKEILNLDLETANEIFFNPNYKKNK